MASSITHPNRPSEGNCEIWESLKQAIADSSGFKRWQQDQEAQIAQAPLEVRVRRYLRETLETLAY